MGINKQELIGKIHGIEGLSNEEKSALIELLKTHKKYGLVWEDKPEDVEERLREELPILTEVKERAIISEDSEAPNHILIEGDNLEALTALTYTHAGKIDVIYIDPPYNTGHKDFKYDDAFVDKNDGYAHSKWISFMEKRYDFIIPNKAERIKMLGLDFMIKDEDNGIDVTIPENKEVENSSLREVIYDENQFNKISKNTNDEIMNIYNELDNYVMSLNSDIKKNTTSVYLSYYYGKNFIELWFQKNSLKYVLMTGDYNDPNEMVGELAESYQWTHDRYIIVNQDSDIEYVKNILKQSYEKNLK